MEWEQWWSAKACKSAPYQRACKKRALLPNPEINKG
jgi:hypothetical protein